MSILGLEKVTDNTKQKNKTDTKSQNKEYRSQLVIPYVEGVSEGKTHRVMKKYGVARTVVPSILRDRETTENTTGRTQEGRRQHEQ